MKSFKSINMSERCYKYKEEIIVKEARYYENLTDEEWAKPYSKYMDRPITPPNPQLMDILKQGPMDPTKALAPERISDLMEAGYTDVETGYCVLPNGAAYVAVNNQFPGVTMDMLKWWFAWHPLEDLRYMIWYKDGHNGISISDDDRARILHPDTPMDKKVQGTVHHVIEDVGVGLEDITIQFLSPEELGFDMNTFDPARFAVFGANGISQSRSGGPKAPAVMCHFIRETDQGVESRTRFWMGYHVIDGQPVKLLPDGITIPEVVPMGLAMHNVMEYTHLASFLPELYLEMEGKIQ